MRMWVKGIALIAMFLGATGLIVTLYQLNAQLSQMEKIAGNTTQSKMDRRLSQIENAISKQQQDVDKLTAQWRNMDVQLNQLLKAINSLQTRQKSLAQFAPTLDGIEQKLGNTQALLEKLQQQWHGTTYYQTVDIALGELPAGQDTPKVYKIPDVVPDAAREILVYAQVATGYVDGGPHFFQVSVQPDQTHEASFTLYAVGQPQKSWTYNSDNFWLPMPENRELYIKTKKINSKPFFGEWNSQVSIIAYR
ncbi:MAG: hypothetical protein CSA09_02495 [Candidatus Contendobacter odensis]|uniref:Uncharacterized protein n=1 Tax=Candidatus Contendibacter odensensis TaxID=1400860 RepID=A0A2G6PFL6_9GAMM|nr:MAG: hypothetical protein CSA09_02495 [Candidatus Contendobacter odensis]